MGKKKVNKTGSFKLCVCITNVAQRVTTIKAIEMRYDAIVGCCCNKTRSPFQFVYVWPITSEGD